MPMHLSIITHFVWNCGADNIGEFVRLHCRSGNNLPCQQYGAYLKLSVKMQGATLSGNPFQDGATGS